MNIISTLFAHSVALAAMAVVLIHQVLKFQFFPLNFANKYPVPTLILLSAAASVVVAWRTALTPASWTDWVVLGSTIAVTAALTYITTIKNWAELRAAEGPGKI